MLIFDFDGILLDSVREAAVTAFIAASGVVATSLEELPGNSAELFIRNRFHFQPAGDAPLLMRWCLEHSDQSATTLLSAAGYAQLLRSVQEPVKARTEAFFAARRQFLAKDRTRWLQLNAPYEPLWNSLGRIGPERVVILTNKNREAVIELTGHFGLPISPENVYSGDHGATKTENLELIDRRFGCAPYRFVDDSLPNLKELDHACNRGQRRLDLLLGGWGYLGPDDREEAARAGYPVVTQEEIIRIFEEES